LSGHDAEGNPQCRWSSSRGLVVMDGIVGIGPSLVCGSRGGGSLGTDWVAASSQSARCRVRFGRGGPLWGVGKWVGKG
jgi:hypothetical protein